MNHSSFSPFYERPAKWFSGFMVGEFIVSLTLGLLVLAALYASIGNDIFTDWSAFLPVIISTAMFSLYIATYTLRSIFPEMDARLHPKSSDIYMEPLNRYLSNERFVLTGIFFGVVNCLFGDQFGLPYTDNTVTILTLFFSYFVVGFVCGMAAYSIFAVSISINAFTKEARHSLDYSSPDNCGGTKVIGDALIIFGGVTLIIGVMISVYILKAQWTGGNDWWITSLKAFWIIFPYLMSLTALIVPSSVINSALKEYKLNQEIILKERLSSIREKLEQPEVNPARIKELREDYEFLKSTRTELYKMRTWPIDIGANYKFLSVFLGNVIVSTSGTYSWLCDLGALECVLP